MLNPATRGLFELQVTVQVCLLKRPVSTEELQRPGGRYVRKSFTASPNIPVTA